MLLIFTVLIFIRPFISSLAFPCLNFIYTTLLLFFLSAYIIYKKPPFSKIHALIRPVVLFILALAVSTVFSQNRQNSLLELHKYTGGVILFFIAASFSEKDRSLTIRVIIFAGLVISFLAIYQYFFGFRDLLDYLSNNKLQSIFVSDYLASRRVFVPFVTPGILGGYLAMLIPLFLIDKNRVWPVIPVLLALFLTRSLGAFLSLFCVLFIYLCAQRKLKKGAVFYLLGLFILIAIIFILRSLTQKEHIQPVFSTVMRFSYWRDTLGVIKGHLLTGVGPGNFNLKISRYAHNSYLQIWAEMGILGLFSFLWIVYSAVKPCFKNQAVDLLAASAVFLIHNFLDFTFFLPEVVFIWWVILGLLVAQCRQA